MSIWGGCVLFLGIFIHRLFLFEVVLFSFFDMLIYLTYSAPLFDFLRCFPSLPMPHLSASIRLILLCDYIC